MIPMGEHNVRLAKWSVCFWIYKAAKVYWIGFRFNISKNEGYSSSSSWKVFPRKLGYQIDSKKLFPPSGHVVSRMNEYNGGCDSGTMSRGRKSYCQRKKIFMGYIHSLAEDITNKFGHYIWRSLEPGEDCYPILERFKKLLSCISFYDGEIV